MSPAPFPPADPIHPALTTGMMYLGDLLSHLTQLALETATNDGAIAAAAARATLPLQDPMLAQNDFRKESACFWQVRPLLVPKERPSQGVPNQLVPEHCFAFAVAGWPAGATRRAAWLFVGEQCTTWTQT